MKEGRLHIRINKHLLDCVREVALKRGITLTELVESSFRKLLIEESILLDENIDPEIGVSQL